jgi:NADPH:quinone reductase-like Zn-dependent oxidoreductase
MRLPKKLEAQQVDIPKQNSVVRIVAPHITKFQDVPLPKLAPGDLLIKVAYTHISPSDMKALEGDGERYPVIPGREFSGFIAGIGANNRYQEHFSIGDSVTGVAGEGDYDGACAMYVVVPGNRVRRIPEGMGTKEALLNSLQVSSEASTILTLPEFSRAEEVYRAGKHPVLLCSGGSVRDEI